MSFTVELALVLAVVAAACAVPGVFLVLRRTAMVSDAIGHVLLLGVVATYLIVRDGDSPWLLVGAALAGLLTVVMVETLQRTRRLKADAALGLVFSTLFALGVLLATLQLRNVHLDVDRVLMGQAEYATYPRWRLFGLALKPVWVMAVVLGLNVTLAAVFFKELKLTTFDPELAAALGFRPALVHYALMAVVALTAVAAFDAVGPVLVVGFFVVPAASAFLLTDRLGVMLVQAAVLGAIGAVAGTHLAIRLDTNIAGTVAGVLGGVFAVVFVAAPGRGILAQAVRRWQQKREFHEMMLAIHLLQHEGTDAEADEAHAGHVHEHLSWTVARTATVVRRAERNGLVRREGELLKLTQIGRDRARSVLNG